MNASILESPHFKQPIKLLPSDKLNFHFKGCGGKLQGSSPTLKEIQMATLPENQVTQQDLEIWYKQQEQLKALKASEMLLRTKIYKGLFINPVEGTNTVPLSEGWVIKAKRIIQRDIDAAALQANTALDPETKMSRLSANGMDASRLIKWKPELVTKEYRLLSEEQLKVFDECLIIKDGSASLEIVMPASTAKAAQAAAVAPEQDPANLC